MVGVFVATAINLHTWRATLDFAITLGLDEMMFNRFNPGGRGAQHIALLQAEAQQIRQALDVAEDFSAESDFPIVCPIPAPPCLIDTSRYRRLAFGFCPAGTQDAYYTLDPLGNVRPCNHSPRILGSLWAGRFEEMLRTPAMMDFRRARPPLCSGCRLETQCQGGCKAAAEFCNGSAWDMDPFLAAGSSRPGNANDPQPLSFRPARGVIERRGPSRVLGLHGHEGQSAERRR